MKRKTLNKNLFNNKRLFNQRKRSNLKAQGSYLRRRRADTSGTKGTLQWLTNNSFGMWMKGVESLRTKWDWKTSKPFRWWKRKRDSTWWWTIRAPRPRYTSWRQKQKSRGCNGWSTWKRLLVVHSRHKYLTSRSLTLKLNSLFLLTMTLYVSRRNRNSWLRKDSKKYRKRKVLANKASL